MSKVYLMVTITGRGQGEQFAALNRTENLPVMMVALGKGCLLYTSPSPRDS